MELLDQDWTNHDNSLALFGEVRQTNILIDIQTHTHTYRHTHTHTDTHSHTHTLNLEAAHNNTIVIAVPKRQLTDRSACQSLVLNDTNLG